MITPSASEIEKNHLKSLNLVHVPGTLKDFTKWFRQEMPNPPTGWDLASARRPELRSIQKLTDLQKRAVNSVTLVSADSLPRSKSGITLSAIRDFYKGYKPKWIDILDEVPAELAFVKNFSNFVEDYHECRKCVALVGSAGSGKSTAMMIVALHLSKTTTIPVYFLREAVSDFKEIVIGLEQINSSPFYLFVDKMEAMHNEITEILESSHVKHVCIVASERLNIWNRRVKAIVKPVISGVFEVGKIQIEDAGKILEKLEAFGPWTHLQKMTHKNRFEKICKKADRQLLIGLMEATTGLGFTEIISEDFKSLRDDPHKKFLTIIGFASLHRSTLSPGIVESALSNLGIAEDINMLSRDTEGIVENRNKKYSARHPVYARKLFEKIIPVTMIRDCLVAVLEAFSDYEAPVIKHVGKADGIVFKSIVNHHFVKEMMHGDEEKVRSVYEAFETKFHVDGLYWLQYGLALRSFGRQFEALEKLKTAKEAYISPQIEHAYAQQLMIIASKSTSWDDAEPLLEEAINTLRELNLNTDATDTYPIVTLAEGHLSVMSNFDVEGLQVVAKQYANELYVVNKRYPGARLQEATNNVMKLATTGSWKESYGVDYYG